jgi:hypothetical protein
MALDLHNNIKVSRAISPKAAGTDNTAWVSQILDTANFSANEIVFAIGANTDADATFTVLLEEGDNASLTDNAAVANADMYGTEAAASWTFADDNETRKLGYRGTKRYIRATVTPADNAAGDIFMAALWIQYGARNLPQS